MAAYEKGDQETGDKKFADAKDKYDIALHACDKKVTDPIVEWSKKWNDLESRDDWDKISKDITESQKDVLEDDVKQSFYWWDKPVPFNAGMFMGRWQKVFLDNAPAEFLQ